MKVILTKDIKELGKTGELINASEGYVRNFLLPRKLAIIADAAAMKDLEKKKKIIEQKGDKLHDEAKSIAGKIEGVLVKIIGKAGTGTKLYGSVTNNEIAAALLTQHKLKVDKRKIQLIDPIKSIGVFEIPIKLHHDVTANVHVEVVAE